MTSCARSRACNFISSLLTCDLTVATVSCSCPAISPFDSPAAIRDSVHQDPEPGPHQDLIVGHDHGDGHGAALIGKQALTR
jgi:hypothetical protein